MIICFEGQQGQGKTRSALLLINLIKTGQIKLSTNVSIDNFYRFRTLTEFSQVTDSIVLFDELYLDMDSRNSKDNRKLTYIITQQRKRQNIFFYTAQMIEMVDIRVRQNTTFLIRCQDTADHQIWQIYDYLPLVYGRPVIPKVVRFSKELFNRFAIYEQYKTLEVVAPLLV